MIIKILIIFSNLLQSAYERLLDYLDDSQVNRPLPDNVRDVYDEAEYKKWRAYNKDKGKVSLIETIFEAVITTGLLAFNVYAMIFNYMDGINIYVQYLVFIVGMTLVTSIIGIPFSYYRIFVIEEKYGMNKSTKKTFFLDGIRGFFVEIVTGYGLMAVIMLFYKKFGNAGMIGIIIALIVIMIVLNLIVIPLMRIFNKFEPLPDGELKEKLEELCAKYNVKIKKIVVKDASRRTTKANAFCTGLSKKTISLDDNLVNNYTPDQIVAVFAHEFAHAKYKHMLKSLPFSVGRMVLLVAALTLVLNIESLFTSFGFEGVNYFFAIMLLTLVSWPVSKGLDALGNTISRKHEYEADSFAAREGYGAGLISGLKQLNKESLSDINPHPLVVKLEYSHPTLSQRIENIVSIDENCMMKIEQMEEKVVTDDAPTEEPLSKAEALRAKAEMAVSAKEDYTGLKMVRLKSAQRQLMMGDKTLDDIRHDAYYQNMDLKSGVMDSATGAVLVKLWSANPGITGAGFEVGYYILLNGKAYYVGESYGCGLESSLSNKSPIDDSTVAKMAKFWREKS